MASGNVFHFRLFSVTQEKSPMKVGTDSVLLGAWCHLENALDILDIGTGTGILALMAAQRSNAAITAIDIDPEAISEASSNASASPWADRIVTKCIDVRDFYPDSRFGAIICNPPYFRNSLKSPVSGRNLARHTVTLDYGSLAQAAARMMCPDGRLSVIIPHSASGDFHKACALNGLFPERITDVVTKEGREPSRTLITMTFHPTLLNKDTIVVSDSDGNRTGSYSELTSAFYLH